MEKIDVYEIESAFNDLISELEKIKQLNEIAESYKSNTELLSLRLKEYYDLSKNRDVFIAKTLDNYVEKISVIQNTIEVQILHLKGQLSELTNSNLNVIASINEGSNSILIDLKQINDELIFLKQMNDKMIADSSLLLANQTQILTELKMQEKNSIEIISTVDKLVNNNHDSFVEMQKQLEQSALNSYQQVQNLSEQVGSLKKENTINRLINVAVMILVILLLIFNFVN